MYHCSIIRTYKYKLKFSKSQQKRVENWLNICRYLYNNALEHRITAYRSNGSSISKYDQYNELPAIKNELPWMKDVHSQVLQQVLDRVDRSYQNFFNGAGFPKFQGKKRYKSLTFKQGVSIVDGKIKLPKIGLVKYFNSREIPANGIIKTTTLTKQLSGWFISICVEFNSPTISVDNSHAVGIDVGVKHFATLSDETVIDSPYFLEPRLKELRRLQRKLSRQDKKSNSRTKTVHQIRKLYLKITNSRKDYLHKTSAKIAQQYSACYIEDLKIANMTKLNPTLSRRMLDNSFREFRSMLEYKFAYNGKLCLPVPPHYTSQECSFCGVVDKKSRLSQSEFVCTNCGHVENADINASKNILARGTSLSTQRKPLG